MKRTIETLLILALLLTACSSPIDWGEILPDTGNEQPIASEIPAPAGTAVIPPLETNIVELPPATPTEALPSPIPPTSVSVETNPVTHPVYATQLMNAHVLSENLQPLGQINGFVAGSRSAQVLYLTLPVSDQGPESTQRLVPWSATRLMIPLSPAESDAEADFQLLFQSSPESLASAPILDVSRLNSGSLTGWQGEVDRYWSVELDLLPATGQAESTGLPVYLGGNAINGFQTPAMAFDGSNIGQIEDLVIDPAGNILYTILGTNPSATTNSRLLPIPWRAWIYDAGQNGFRLRAATKSLEDAPGYASLAMLPDLSISGWDDPVILYWADFIASQAPTTTIVPTPAATLTPTPTITPLPLPTATLIPPIQPWTVFVVRASELFSSDVVDTEKDVLGFVTDFLIERDGEVAWIVIDLGGSIVPAPWAAFEWSFDEAQLVFTLRPRLLRNAPAAASLNELRSVGRAWENDAVEYWSMEAEVRFLDVPEQAPISAQNLFVSGSVWASGERLGEVEDVFWTPEGEPRYLVLDWDGRFIPIPWAYIQLNAVSNRILFEGEVDILEEAPGEERINDLDTSDPDWEAVYWSYWNR